MLKQLVTTALMALLVPSGILFASELRLEPRTEAAWESFLSSNDQRSDAGTDSQLHLDFCTRRNELVSGHILISPAKDKGIVRVPGGLIHDWTGWAFIPDSNLTDVLSVLGDHDHYNEFYAPTVVRSRAVSGEASTRTFSMTWHEKVVTITASIQADFTEQSAVSDTKHVRIVTQSGPIREIRDFGLPDESMLPPDVGHGYIWRLYSILDLEETDGGVALGLRQLPSVVTFRAAFAGLSNRS